MSDILADLAHHRELLATIWQRYAAEGKRLRASIAELSAQAAELVTTLHPGDVITVRRIWGPRYSLVSIRLCEDDRYVAIVARQILRDGGPSKRNTRMLELIRDVRRYHATPLLEKKERH